VKVLDFGISKTYDSTLHDTNLTRSGTILGTPKYMAPEQLANERVDQRTDVYALGIILYELVTGYLPFEGETFALLASNKLTGNATPLSSYVPNVDPGLETAVMQAIARDPDERHPSVPAFAHTLSAFADGVEIDTAGIPLPETLPGGRRRVPAIEGTTFSTRRRRRSGILIAAAAGVLAVMLGLGALVGWLLSRSEEPQFVTTPLPSASPEAPPPVAEEPPPVAEEPDEPPTEPADEPEVEGPAPTADDESPAPMRRARPTMRGMSGAGRTGMLSWDDF
jgi:serine/threonine-protein kinase